MAPWNGPNYVVSQPQAAMTNNRVLDRFCFSDIFNLLSFLLQIGQSPKTAGLDLRDQFALIGFTRPHTFVGPHIPKSNFADSS